MEDDTKKFVTSSWADLHCKGEKYSKQYSFFVDEVVVTGIL